jgi:hypothetical protein
LSQRLRIRIGYHKINALEFGLDHIVDGVPASATDPDNQNSWVH